MNIFERARPLDAGYYQSGLDKPAPAFGVQGQAALIYVVSGHGTWSMGPSDSSSPWTGPIRRGDWLAVPSGMVPVANADPASSFAYFYAIFDLTGHDPQQAHIQLSWPWDRGVGSSARSLPEPFVSDTFKPEMAVLFRQLQNELKRPSRPGAAVAARAHMAVLGVAYARLLADRTRTAESRKVRRATGTYPRTLPEPLARALDFLDANLNRELALADLARVARYSERRFVQIFRQFLGVSPMAYVRERRVKEAQRLLAAGGLTVKEIAARLNFADAQHFSRVFRQVTGISPTEFACGGLPVSQRESGYFAQSAR